MDLENAKPELPQTSAAEDIQKNFTQHKELYEKLRDDVAIKMQFLDENRVGTHSYGPITTMFLYVSSNKM